MKKKKNKPKSLFTTLFSMLIYKKKTKPREFNIPQLDNEDKEETDTTNTKIVVSKQKNKSKYKRKHYRTSIDEVRSEREKELDKELDKKHEEKQKENFADDNKISNDINLNIDYLKKKFHMETNKDFIIREITIAKKYKAFIAFIDGMADRITINDYIVRPLLRDDLLNDLSGNDCELDYILKHVLETNQAEKISTHEKMVYEILTGNTCLFLEGCNFYISSETKGYDKRNVDRPQTEGVVKGSQEAFNEDVKTNTILIRKIIKNNDLITEYLVVGERNNSRCAIMYLKGIINPAIVAEVKRRINGIKSDLVYGQGMLEQFIDDKTYSLIPTMLSTERPDRTASHIVEGKLAIIIDGTPFAIIVPVTIGTIINTSEDSTMRWPIGTFLRLIRLFAIFVAMLLPGLYVAVTYFHSEMIPTELVLAISKARENVPFPTIIEVILMEVAFELIREAGLRIPGIIGNTIGIIGALILGQAAVDANIVSPVLIIIIAFTGLGNFAIPDFILALEIRILRFFFIAVGAFLGFYGITLLAILFLALFVETKSFGVSLFSPIAPKTTKSNDLIIKWPSWMQEKRPDFLNTIDKRRQPYISRKWWSDDHNPAKTSERKKGNE